MYICYKLLNYKPLKLASITSITVENVPCLMKSIKILGNLHQLKARFPRAAGPDTSRSP